MDDHEEAFVSTFVIPEKRIRYSEFLAKPKRRGEILDRFNHFFDFVPELAVQVPRTSPAQLAALLRRSGAPASAWIIGGGSYDACEMPLAEAVERAFDSGWGAVVSCVPGRLVLYMQEFPLGDTFLLASRAASTADAHLCCAHPLSYRREHLGRSWKNDLTDGGFVVL